MALAVALAFAATAPSANPLPRDPARLARQVVATERALHAAIGRWRTHGDLSRATPPRDVARAAFAEQRIVLALADDETLARRLPASAATLVAEARARRELARLTPPRPLSAFRVGRALPPATLLGYYAEAERRFGVDRHVLAAVNFVESDFGRLRNESVAGARGPMQFMPSTWRAYGLGGDVHDPQDAILGAANYLRASGAPRRLRRALYAYNPARAYVDAVLVYVARMRSDPNAFLAYYCRQLIVRTPAGRRRLTSFGLS